MLAKFPDGRELKAEDAEPEGRDEGWDGGGRRNERKKERTKKTDQKRGTNQRLINAFGQLSRKDEEEEGGDGKRKEVNKKDEVLVRPEAMMNETIWPGKDHQKSRGITITNNLITYFISYNIVIEFSSDTSAICNYIVIVMSNVWMNKIFIIRFHLLNLPINPYSHCQVVKEIDSTQTIEGSKPTKIIVFEDKYNSRKSLISLGFLAIFDFDAERCCVQ